jgi:hypothetical protein
MRYLSDGKILHMVDSQNPLTHEGEDPCATVVEPRPVVHEGKTEQVKVNTEIARVRRKLRSIDGVTLLRASGPHRGPHHPSDAGHLDVIGTYLAHCTHGCRTAIPFAFHVVPKGTCIENIQDTWGDKLRRGGWIVAIVADADEAREVLDAAVKVIAKI